ncbi:hypothetical protein [Streptomyces longisporoflavus]|uniref:Uncharacterized protein n=1 Tax=Streptomyces longisporoflavus TaxID=28044 RepID=A0ABW7QM57_9ACTN
MPTEYLRLYELGHNDTNFVDATPIRRGGSPTRSPDDWSPSPTGRPVAPWC